MLRRTLGRSGIEVGAIDAGCWAIGGPSWRVEGGTRTPFGWGRVDDAESIRAIHRALDLGITLFDTANSYGAGHSERVLGRALHGSRAEAVISTKFACVIDEAGQDFYADRDMPMTLESIRASCQASLARLDTDYLDLFLFHDGGHDLERAAEVRDILEVLVAEGHIRWYGWSTDDPARARVFAQGAHCTAVEFRLNALFNASEMLDVCQEFHLGGLIKSPLNGGFLSGKFHPGYTFAADDERSEIDFADPRWVERLRQVAALRPVLTSAGRSMTQGALAWILTRSPLVVPIPGFKSVAQVEENAGTLQFDPLSPEQMRQVEEVMGRA